MVFFEKEIFQSTHDAEIYIDCFGYVQIIKMFHTHQGNAIYTNYAFYTH